MKPRLCANGCDAPVWLPSKVICRGCMDKITETLEEIGKRMEADRDFHGKGGREMSETHELKCWPRFYSSIVKGRKTFEIRKDDGRGFCPGDTLYLREWDPGIGAIDTRTGIPKGGYTGPTCEAEVMWTCALDDLFDLYPQFQDLDNPENIVIMSIKLKEGGK